MQENTVTSQLLLLHSITFKKTNQAFKKIVPTFNQTCGMQGSSQARPRFWGWYTNNMHNGVLHAANIQSKILVYAQDHVFSWHKSSLSIITTRNPQRGLRTATAIGPKSDTVTYGFDPKKQAADTEKEIQRLLQLQRGTLSPRQENLINSFKFNEVNGNIQFPRVPRIISIIDVDRAIKNFPILDRFFSKLTNTQIPDKQTLRDDTGDALISFIKISSNAKSEDALHAAKTMETTLNDIRRTVENDPMLKNRTADIDEMVVILQTFQKTLTKNIE